MGEGTLYYLNMVAGVDGRCSGLGLISSIWGM